MHASGYLDGEPAKAVLEVQRSLVSAEGNGVLGVQPLKLLLVVDHKNLPENTLVRCSEKTSTGGREKLEEDTESPTSGCSTEGRGICMLYSSLPPEVGRNGLVPTPLQFTS